MHSIKSGCETACPKIDADAHVELMETAPAIFHVAGHASRRTHCPISMINPVSFRNRINFKGEMYPCSGCSI